MSKLSWIRKLTMLRFFLAGFETYSIVPTAWHYIKSLDQTTFFLALVVSAYNFGAVIATPFGGFITDRVGKPRVFFICSCIVKVVAYIMYSVNLSAYFPLFGRFLSGLSDIGVAVVLGQIALQTDEKSRGSNFIIIEAVYCLGSAFGPGFGAFVTFKASILGWKVDEGNSPGIVLSIIWLLFLIFSLLLPKNIWMQPGASIEANATSSDDEDEIKSSKSRKPTERLAEDCSELKPRNIIVDIRIVFLLLLIFSSESFSSTATFYVPLLALDHFHLQLIYTKLLFLNCTIFTILVFICLYIASEYFEERKIFAVSFFMQIIAIAFLTFLAFSWDQVTTVQYYILLLYICFGMPYFLYPFANSLLSKITDSGNATFVQGISYATVHSAIVVSRVFISFVFTKMSLIYYCMGMGIIWLVVVIWYTMLYEKLVPEL